MKILYIHQYFLTPEEGGCTRSYYLAKGLIQHGHEVTMITSSNDQRGNKNVDGIDVRYLPVKYNNAYGFIRRILAFLLFVRLAKREAATVCGVDLAYVMTTPLTTGLIALHLKKKKNIPYYFEVGDLWPEAPIQMGAIKNGVLKKLLYSFESKCYFHANKVIALSPPIRNYIESVSPQTKVYVIPNLSHCHFFEPSFSIKHFNEQNPLKIGYIGAIGEANNLSYLLDCAKYCEQEKLPIQFTLMGAGKQLALIKKKAHKLQNTKIIPFGNAQKVKDVMDTLDISYVSFLNKDVLGTGSPNKFFDSLAAGKLTVINFNGWIKNIVEKHKCGFHHDPEKPEDFARKMQVFLKNPSLMHTYQRNARRLAEHYYDRELQIQKLVKIINNEKKISLSDSEVYILTA
ncbi:MAG: glycosyltransferase involved in cell wall biosynthesis [Cyclobacteriaceae bacterium]